ncbi:MAG: serine/threonine protein kinase [Kofleriaceae bacterium]|nr:serine/threonine protein kinase [Kofleriaceae bacterium]
MLRRGRGLAYVVAACGVGVVTVLLYDRPPLPTAAAAIALAVQGAVCALLAVTIGMRRSRGWRYPALVVAAAITLVPTYFFGPHGEFAAVVALLLVLAGMALESPNVPPWAGWATYGALAGSELAAFALVMFDVLPDRSLVPVRLPGHPAWHYWAAQLPLQGVYLAAYVAGRAAARRYRALAVDLDEATRAAARQDALLAEARADYARAVEIARRGAVAPTGPRDLGRGAPSEEHASSATLEQASVATIDDGGDAPASWPVPVAAAPVPPPPEATPTPSGALRTSAWNAAYQAKMRHQGLAVLSLCGGGAVLMALITRTPFARGVALVAVAGIVATLALRSLAERRPRAAGGYVAWTVIAAFAIGPAYAWGIHSGFAAVIATLLFAGGLFRAPQARRRDRGAVIAVVLATHSAVFVLVMARVIPDDGNLAVIVPGVPTLEPYLEHVLLQLTFITAFVAGTVVDRRFAATFRSIDAAHREVLRREATLRETHAEIDAALRRIGAGLFTGTTVRGYAVGRLLGRGGMGEVYEATDPDGVRVALKLLRGDRAGDPASLARFTAEADVLVQVDSPFVARVLAVGRDAGELPFIAMAYVEGRSLAALLRERERLSVAGVASLVRDIARGLQDVHAAGFVHLDVKPSNILLTEELEMGSRWSLVDFGVARLVRGRTTDAIAGTPTPAPICSACVW